MKSQKPLSENLGKCWKNYTHLVHRSREKLSPKNIHQLRIATQRLEAVLSLVHSLKDVKYENQITDLLKKVRKSLGPLRDSQVESPLLNRIVNEKSKDKESKKLVKFFRHDKQGAEKKAHRALLNVHLKQEKSILDKLLKKMKNVEVAKNKKEIKNQLERKIKSSVNKFNLILNKIDPVQMKDIHSFRIFAKKLRYQGECLASLEKKSRFSLKELKNVQSITGRIQNDTVLLKKLTQFGLGGKKNGDLNLREKYTKIQRHRDKLIKNNFGQLSNLKWLN